VIIWETFHWPRKYPVLKTPFNIWVVALILLSGNSLKIRHVMRSCPVALFECNCFIADRNSGSLNFLTGDAAGQEDSLSIHTFQ